MVSILVPFPAFVNMSHSGTKNVFCPVWMVTSFVFVCKRCIWHKGCLLSFLSKGQLPNSFLFIIVQCIFLICLI